MFLLPRKFLAPILLAAFLLLSIAAPAAAGERDPEGNNSIALLLSGYSGFSVEEIEALSESGASYGNLARALAYASAAGISPADALALSEGAGWGPLFSELGISPGGNGLGALVSAAHRNANSIKVGEKSCDEEESGEDGLPADVEGLGEPSDCESDDEGDDGPNHAYGQYKDKDEKSNNGKGQENKGGNGNNNGGNGKGKGKSQGGDD